MKTSILVTIILIISSTGFAEELPVVEIMKKNYRVNRTRDRCNEVTMIMYNKHGKKRIRKLRINALLMENGIDEQRLLRFLYPPDVKGTGFLVIEHEDAEDDMWFYLPTLRKSRRKLAGNKKDSFMGTEFTFGDIVGAKVHEYQYTMKGENRIDGIDCYVIEAVPATKEVFNDYGYSKRIDYIRKDIFTRQKVIFYDRYEKLFKTLYCSNPMEMDPENYKWFVTHREMVNHKNGRRTILKMDKIRINIGINRSLFTIRYLERGS